MENQEAATTATAQAEQVTPDTNTGSLVDFILNDGQTQVAQQAAQEQQNQAQKPPAEETKTFDPKEWLKQEFDVDDVSIIKGGMEELKTLREKVKEQDFVNEDSKKVYDYLKEGKEDDLYNFLNQKKQVEKLSKADLTDKSIAAELVKFGIQRENPNLTSDDVDFLFKQKYSIPKEPKEEDFAIDTDYEAALGTWKEQVQNIEKGMIIEAKMQQPKLAQLQQEIVLPDIRKEQQSNEPSQEDLAALQQMQQSFLQTVKTSVDGFKGFDVNVKDKDVDYVVSYAPSVEEKTLVSEKLNEFAQSGFDANVVLAERWVNKDGKSLNVEQMVKDLSLIYSNEKQSQKLVADAANKRLELYLKEKKNINLNETNNSQFVPNGQKNQQEALVDALLAI